MDATSESRLRKARDRSGGVRRRSCMIFSAPSTIPRSAVAFTPFGSRISLGASLPPSRQSHGEDSFGIVGAHFDRAAMRLRNLVCDVKSETEAIIASALRI